MKEIKWQVLLGITLVFLSALFYFIHYLIFHDPHHIFIYLVGDVAFVPVEVLLVTVIIHRLLEHKEKKSRLEKTNMVIEAFYSEMGTKLLAEFSDKDPDLESIRSSLAALKDFSNADFRSVDRRLAEHHYKVDIEKVALGRLAAFLVGRREFLLGLWGNPHLLEHESFTEVLRAVMHLTEELASRDGFETLPDSDREHLAGDITRAYGRLARQWVKYMEHLKDNYPYLFSLAVRTNPFDREASPLVT